jgi:hypothetical protein
MNSYTVTIFPPVGGPSRLQVDAKAYVIEGEFVTFTDDLDQGVLSIPIEISPIIQRDAAGATP